MEVSYSKTRPDNQTITDTLKSENLSDIIMQPSGASDIVMRIPEINEQRHQKILGLLSEGAKKIDPDAIVTEKRFESFGPTLGAELKRRSLYAVLFVIIAIILYLAYAFRKVSHPVSSWKFGTVAVIALIHDVLILVGLFSIFGHFFGTEINSLFITALLTLLGNEKAVNFSSEEMAEN